ncbi:MAG: DMT family transporter [bacterium]
MRKMMLGNILLLLTALIWGTGFVFQREGMGDIPPLTFNAARMALAAMAVGLLSVRRQGERRTTLVGGLVCGVFLAFASICQQIGLVTTEAGKAGFLTSFYLLLVPVLEALLLRRRQPGRVWAAVALGLGGMYLLTVSGGFALRGGDRWLMLCALLFSGHILACGFFAEKTDPVALSALQFGVAALISGAGALLTETPHPAGLLAAAGPILYCGLVSGGLGYTLQMVGQRYTRPAVASLLMSLESVFAALAGALLLRERMSPREIAGCVLLFAAILLAEWGGAQKK